MILAIDCGSTNHKVALFDQGLCRLSTCTVPVTYLAKDTERVEFESEKLWQDTLALIRQACAKAGVHSCHIETISIASQAQTVTLLDSSGKAMLPFLSWADKRAQAESAELTERMGSDFHQHCGFAAPVPQLQLSKLLWISRHLPAKVCAHARVVSLPSFLAIRLAGLHCTDTNLAGMSGIFSLAENTWWSEALSACSISPDACGELVGIGTSVPARVACPDLELSPNVRVVFAGNDQTAGAYANSLGSSRLVLTLGTALVAYRFAGSASGPFTKEGCWGPCPGGGFYELITRDEGCAALDWAVRHLMGGNEAKFLDAAATAQPGQARFYPQQMGRAEAWTGSTTTAARARAVMEGICFSLREMVESNGFSDSQPDPVTVIGGGSASEFWLQLLADVLRRPVCRGGGDILLGAAMLARPGFGSPEAPPCKSFAPELARARQYEDLYLAWSKQTHSNVMV